MYGFVFCNKLLKKKDTMKLKLFSLLLLCNVCFAIESPVKVQVFTSDWQARKESVAKLPNLANASKGEIINKIVESQPTVAYAVLDYNTGQLIAGKNEHRKQFPASITKVMTLYIMFDLLDAGKLKLTDKIKVSRAAASQIPSKLGLKAGSTITVHDAIIAIIVNSSNDVAYAVAEHIAGSVPKFANLMNAKAKKIGMFNTHFAVSTGLPHTQNYSTAYDLSVMARALMVEHNPYYILFSIKSFVWNRYLFVNHNPLLKYSNVDGLKTGYTNWSGYTLLASAKSPDNSTRLIVTGLGFKTSATRNLFIKELSENYLPTAVSVRNQNVVAVNKPSNLNSASYFIKNEEAEYDKYADNYVTQPVDTSKNVSANNYPIVYTDYTSDLISKDKIIIKPTYAISKKRTYTTKSSKKTYTIQVGAYSSYKSAFNSVQSVYKTKQIKQMLNTGRLVVIKSSNGLYRVRFVGLPASTASKACSTLKNYKVDCYVF